MSNPWEEISLSDYENHMKLESVKQLQAMNEMMKEQFNTYPISCVMILGIAGGNGLEHISKSKIKKVYGVDINSSYLEEVNCRYPNLEGILECLCIDLINETCQLPKADMVIANLLIEYIGYECFQKVIQHVYPKYVSCIIQTNIEDHWVSESPYLHVFDKLNQVHHQIEVQELEKAMLQINYYTIRTLEYMLPNKKKLIQLDFKRKNKNTPTLETERLILRKFTENDLEAIYRIYSDEEVNTFLPWFPLKTMEDAKTFYAEQFKNKYTQEKGYYYAICLKEDNIPIGYINVSASESYDFGYGLCKEFWHKGIVTEASQAVIEQLKEDEIPYITATHDVKNLRSGKVMKKLGMKYQYSYEEQWQPKNILVTFRMYQLNFDGDDSRVYREYWKNSKVHFIEKDI